MPALLPEETQVLVVGAGPTGLAATISLICNGIDPSKLTIVDALEKGANTSRALAIHAATLEALDKYGCASKLIELGIKGSGWAFGDRTTTIFKGDFSCISPYTKFPFVLTLRANRLRNIPYRVVGMKNSTSGKGIDVTFESGEIVRAEYVIGADGSKSVVRQLSGINFADPDGEFDDNSPVDSSKITQMVIADVSLSLEDNRDALAAGASITASKDGIQTLSEAPETLPSDHDSSDSVGEIIYRVGFNVPQAQGDPPSHPSLDYIQSNMNHQAPFHMCSDSKTSSNPVRITKVHWSSRYRTHSSIADVFIKRVHGGTIFLVGDAAHIHSPVGGQGMNLGLRDATGLGRELAEHIRKQGRRGITRVGRGYHCFGNLRGGETSPWSRCYQAHENLAWNGGLYDAATMV
ncbi:FAD/NAD(P)-binding domain-containing protein [Gymnopus androsaceus JB14]|uniref:FAD/NAD(P)-binding domain-containing protein n=1 Tax=Gymnopus androsaceus JB14 TaxID=1447944 RepID=A0A6A4GVI8_9AGAR|nr:FAD/NAD(P)-binding domain-containing protein [Gymnopus androsaceus JB14]